MGPPSHGFQCCLYVSAVPHLNETNPCGRVLNQYNATKLGQYSWRSEVKIPWVRILIRGYDIYTRAVAIFAPGTCNIHVARHSWTV